MRKILTTLLLTIALLGFTTGTPAGAAGDSSQVRFDAGYSNGQALVLYDLQICGVNQNNDRVCWPSQSSRQKVGEVYSVSVPGWWWKLDRGIQFRFYVIGYGDRSCSIQRSNYGNPAWLTVTYTGSNRCSFK